MDCNVVSHAEIGDGRLCPRLESSIHLALVQSPSILVYLHLTQFRYPTGLY